MYKNGIALALVDDIPERIKLTSVEASETDVKRVVEIIPRKKPVRYNDDVWDFSNCFVIRKDARHIIDFTRIPEQIKDPLKDYVLSQIENGAKVSSACSSFLTVRSILLGIMEKKRGIFELITEEDLISWIQARPNKNRTKLNYLAKLAVFYEEMTNNGILHLVNTERLRAAVERLSKIAKYERTNHFPAIPEDFLEKVITMFNFIMRDETKPFDQRMTAGIMLLESQLGLRTSEIVALPDDCLHYHETSEGKIPYITYRSIKAAHGPHEVIYVDHMGTDLAFKTLNYYMELRKRCSHSDQPFLYIDEGSDHYPIKTNVLLRRYRYLIKQYLPEAASVIEGVNQVKLRDGRYYSCPSIHSFRVTVFSAMANSGIPYPFIEKMMSHTPQSRSDVGYYSGVKVTNTAWEDIMCE